MFDKFIAGLRKDIPDMHESAVYAIAVAAGVVFIRTLHSITLSTDR